VKLKKVKIAVVITMPLSRGINIIKKAQLVTLFGLVTGCFSSGKIDSEPKSNVVVLSSTYAVQENLGKGPIEVLSNENLARYRLERKGEAPEYLLVLYPEKLGATLSIKLRDTVNIAEAGTYSSYFDRLLRAHRMLLKGDLDGAKALIDRIEAEYDSGYGTSVLLGNIALLKGDKEGAARQFAFAQSLVPNNGVLSGFVAKSGETEGDAP
jgi:hypothetical protein